MQGVKDGQRGKQGERGRPKDRYSWKCCAYMYHRTCVLASNEYCVQVINKPCVRETRYMHLISWTHHRGREQL